jgi:hypothetical protein
MIEALSALAEKLQKEREQVAMHVIGAGADVMVRPAPDGGWSAREILAHMVASERGLLALAKRIAAGDAHSLPPGYDLNAANRAAVQKRESRPVSELLAEWAENQAAWRAYMETLTPEALDREGAHPGFPGPVSLRQLIVVMLRHERGHHHDIEVLLQGVTRE